MIDIPLQSTSIEIWDKKYHLKDREVPIDKDISGMRHRVSKALASCEADQAYWDEKFYEVQENGATPAGRILSNAGAAEFKPATSLINCTVSRTVEDSMGGIMNACTKSALTLAAGCGIGYEFSTLRPKGSFVGGAGAYTSGPLPFMNIFDTMCFTVSSAGGRRGAQMGTFAVWHPDVESFIVAKREDGTLRQFNLSLLIDDEFMTAVKNNAEWKLIFPLMSKESELDDIETVWKPLFWDESYCLSQNYIVRSGKILCKVYKTINAVDLWDTIMNSTYNFAEPGFLLIDNINKYNNNYFCENIRATNPCGEQPLPPDSACLLGSINVAKYVKSPFTAEAHFDYSKYVEDIRTFTRMLDNVVEMNGLPLKEQRDEILLKRRHGMGYTGLGSMFSLMGIRYGSEESIKLTDTLTKILAVEGFRAGIELAKEKGPAPLLADLDNRRKWVDGLYMERIWNAAPELKELALAHGCRFTHHSSIAPTGTISLSVNNNCSNGIEPSFSHKYTRNVIVPGKKTKESVDVYSYEMLLYKHITGKDEIPETFSVADNVTTKEHIDIQAAAQYWIDSSISKCVEAETTMVIVDDRVVYLNELGHSDEADTFVPVTGETQDHQGTVVKCKSIYTNGIKSCIKLTFDDKSSITCTPNHKIYTENGWFAANEIVVGENIN